VNLGTCGGFAGRAERGETILVDRTVVYDIEERMGDPAAAIAHFSTGIDLSWMKRPWPGHPRRATMLSGDRDLDPADTARLVRQYGAAAGDWESGAIAWVSSRRGVRTRIVRAVSDLVDAQGGEAYFTPGLFEQRSRQIMNRLVDALRTWSRSGGL
jgi:adenosylhomocysteine nucleosidase